jgi:uncharacterized protein (TIGR02118 family)
LVRLIVLYNTPEDAAAFDAHYRDVHAPIVQRYPGLRDLRITHLSGVAGRESTYYLMSEMVFDSLDDLDVAVSSEWGAASARDLRNFAGAGVTVFVAADDAPDA